MVSEVSHMQDKEKLLLHNYLEPPNFTWELVEHLFIYKKFEFWEWIYTDIFCEVN